MMSREDTAPSPGLNMEHGFVRKIEHNQLLHHQQVKEDAARRQEIAKLARRVGQSGKTAKPTMEIYRPPSVRMSKDFSNYSMKQLTAADVNGELINDCHTFTLVSASSENNHKNGNKVHFQTSSAKGSPPSADLKSALKRSKSFGGSDVIEVASMGFERDAFPLEFQGIIRKAMHDPNSLSSRQLMELVRLICSKAVESVQYAEPAAQMCFTIIEKEKGDTFLESLLNSCREWYNERDKLLRSSFTTSSSVLNMHAGGGSRRWTAYVSFLTELYLRLKSHYRHTVLHQSQASGAIGSATSTSPTPAVADQTLTLLMLLYECSQIILKPPSLNNAAEIECLRSMLITIGRQLESDAPQRMQQLILLLRDAFVNPSITAQIRKTILELVELHASHWQLDLPQSMYYFPYTSVERR